MSQQPLAIVGSGMVTGVGLSAPACCAAIRCGINNFQETRFMDSVGEWVVASEVPLEQPWRGPEKLARMLVSVLEETFDTDPGLSPAETPVIVCFSERERPGRLDDLNERVLEAAHELLDFHMHADSMTVSQGRVGGVVALREARKLLYQQRAPAVIVAAVDSYLTAQTLSAYEVKGRLLTADNSNGFIPGEGASAVIVKRPRESSEPQLIALGLGFGVEESTIDSEEPLRADGLVRAIKEALSDARVDMGWLDFRVTDISGEQYGFKEAALALTRVLRQRKDKFDIWHVADCVAELGAAIGPISMALLLHAGQNGYAKGTNVLCHFGNDDGKRAAAILTYQPVIARGK